jgi:phage gp46-like protein
MSLLLLSDAPAGPTPPVPSPPVRAPLSSFLGTATSSALGLADLALVWGSGSGDFAIADSDLASDRGLVTAVLLSLFTDRRAQDDDVPPSGDATDRRGWWADQFAAVEGDKIGSRLWLLDRSKRDNEALLRADEYARECVAWMLEDGVIESADFEVDAATALLIGVTLHRPGKDPVSLRFAHVWGNFEAGAITAAPPAFDPTQGYPASSAAMALAVPGGTFTHGWLCNDTAGNLGPVFGGVSLVASGTGLIYEDAGPRSGGDFAVGFTAGAATGRFSGDASLFDIAANTDELIVAWVGKWSALPSVFGGMFGKASAAFANGWHMTGRDGTSLDFGIGPGAAWSASIAGASGFLLGRWHVGIAVIDRTGTDTARFGVRELFGSTTVLSTSATGINGSAASTASNFTLGRSDWVPGNDNFRLAALYVGKGAGVAAGLAVNLSTALAIFAARISGG